MEISNMIKFENHPLASTNKDLQGEKLPKRFLQQFREKCPEKTILHPQHDQSLEPVGYVENLRLIEDKQNPGEWILIGDISTYEGKLDDAIGGFSISGAIPIRRTANPDFLLYIPIQGYSDQALVDSLLKDETLSLYKWIKKAEDPTAVAIFTTTIAFVLAPIWSDVYRRKIAPRIDKFIKEYWPRLSEKGLSLEHVQIIDYDDREIEVRMLGSKASIPDCFKSENCLHAISEAEKLLKTEKRKVMRIIMYWDETDFKIHRIEFIDGEYTHFA